MLYLTSPTSVQTPVFLGLQRTAERLRDQITLEQVLGGRYAWGLASGYCECVDKFEDEVAWEGAAEVADAVEFVSTELHNLLV